MAGSSLWSASFLTSGTLGHRLTRASGLSEGCRQNASSSSVFFSALIDQAIHSALHEEHPHFDSLSTISQIRRDSCGSRATTFTPPPSC